MALSALSLFFLKKKKKKKKKKKPKFIQIFGLLKLKMYFSLDFLTWKCKLSGVDMVSFIPLEKSFASS